MEVDVPWGIVTLRHEFNSKGIFTWFVHVYHLDEPVMEWFRQHEIPVAFALTTDRRGLRPFRIALWFEHAWQAVLFKMRWCGVPV